MFSLPVYLLALSKGDIQLIFAVGWLLISLLLLVFVVMLFIYMVHSNSRNHVGYIPTALRNVSPHLESIVAKYLGDTTAEYSLVEPGSGFGHVAEHLAKKYTWKEVIALEDEVSVFLLAKVRQLFTKSGITFVKKNIFHYSYPPKTFFYCYILSNMMDKLYQEGKFKGSLVVSLTFPITGVEPTEKFEVPGFQSRLFVYDFR